MELVENSLGTSVEAKSDKFSSQPQSSARFSEQEERELVRKLDLRILPVTVVLYLVNFIDRTNIGNAKVAGLEKDIGLVGYQYNIGLSIFYIAYALSEVPSNLILKRVGADKWIPLLVAGFGVVCFSTAFIRNFGAFNQSAGALATGGDVGGFITVRALLGICEGGVMPGLAFYLSTYYKRHELVLRVGVFTSAASFSGAFGGLLASGLLKINHLKWLPRGAWRNIFLIEGIITIAIGLAGFYLLPGPAEKTRFLNERQRIIAIQRLMNDAYEDDDAYKGDGDIVDAKAVEGGSCWRAFKSLNTWICAICFLLDNISVQGISLFMPSLLKGMGYSVIQSQLRTIPPYLVASVFWIGISYLSLRSGHRGAWILLLAPLVITGLAILVGTRNSQANYAAMFFIAMGTFPQGSILLSWIANNSAPKTVTAVSSALVVAVGTVGPIITSWIYLPHDAPRYRIANSVQIAAQGISFVLVSILILHNRRENRRRAAGKRDYRLSAPEGEVARLGSLHPKFRLVL